MPNSDKNIVITPNRNAAGDPNVVLTGFGNSSITITVPDSSTGTLSFENGTNKLFRVDANVSSGSQLKIGDDTRSSIIEIFSDGNIELDRTTTISGEGLVLPSYKPTSLPNNTEGLMVYDNYDKTLKYNTGTTWYPFTSVDIWDGLVFFVDAGDPRSWPGTGNRWYDLSGTNNFLTLGPAVTWISQFGGVFQFIEDTNSFATGSYPNLSASNNTVITFSRKTVNGNDGRVVTALNNNWLLGHHDNSYGDYYAEGWVVDPPGGSPLSDTTWRMFTGTGNVSTDVWELYINNQINVSNSNGAQGPNGFNINNQYSQSSLAQVSLVACWNRVLSSSEIDQFFQRFRGRFNI